MWPKGQFLITGVLGPNSNAHGPNEFLHLDYCKKLICCMAHIIAKVSPTLKWSDILIQINTYSYIKNQLIRSLSMPPLSHSVLIQLFQLMGIPSIVIIAWLLPSFHSFLRLIIFISLHFGIRNTLLISCHSLTFVRALSPVFLTEVCLEIPFFESTYKKYRILIYAINKPGGQPELKELWTLGKN